MDCRLALYPSLGVISDRQHPKVRYLVLEG